MMDLSKVEEMIKLMGQYGLQELEIEDGDQKVKLVQQQIPQLGMGQAMPMQSMQSAGFASQMPVGQMPVAAPAKQAESDAKPQHAGKEIKSPFVGTFYRAASPGADTFVEIGKRVRKGDTLCIVEAMKLMNEIEADTDGIIVDILVDNEAPVEFDQPLFIIE